METMTDVLLKQMGWNFVKEHDYSLQASNVAFTSTSQFSKISTIFSAGLLYFKYRLAKGIVDLLKQEVSFLPENILQKEKTILIAENRKLGLKFIKIIKIRGE